MGRMQEEEAGLNRVRAQLQAAGLNIERSYKLCDREAYYLEITWSATSTDIVLPCEFLADLPGAREYQESLNQYVAWLQGRLQNFSARDFFCKSGVPVAVEVPWITGRVQNRDASFAHVDVRNLRLPWSVAKCSMIFYGTRWLGALRTPFLREKAMVDVIRTAVDEQTIRFWLEQEHPSELQQLEALPPGGQSSRSGARGIERFLTAKVYWLGFNRGDQRTTVWIADPWDAEYLGTEPAALTRSAQVLNARGKLILDPTNSFASAGDGLLQAAAEYESPSRPDPPVTGPAPGGSDTRTWDAFICHASEDKEDLVRPLAAGHPRARTQDLV